MKTKVIQIGNSKGIRIPKSVLDQCGFDEDVRIEVRNKKLIVYSDKKPRKNWDEEFKKRVVSVKDKTLNVFDKVRLSWDNKEWKW
jgi:antitoxin MazE